jgi:hypothetical protein
MSVQLEILTRQNNTITLELLDNPFILDFVAHLKWVNQHFKISSWQDRIPYTRHNNWNPGFVKSVEQDIVSAVTLLNAMGLNFPIPVAEIVLDQTPRSRDLLNRLHRHFTTSHRSVSHGEPTTTWLDGTEYNFKLDPKDYNEFTIQVHNINTAVHNVEGYYTNDRVQNFTPKFEYQILFDSNQPIDINNNPQDGYFQNIKQEHFQYFTDQLEYDAWLPLHQIQGKNYWVAYFDEDDPRPWDVSTNIQYSGSIALGDRSAIRDPKIISWLESYGITPGPLHCGMPLGRIISGKEYISRLRNNDVLSVTVHE